MSTYKSKHTGAQVDEAVSKVLNGEVGGGATPDWNAQRGEAGYIENRTHYTEKVNGELFQVTEDIYDVHYKINQSDNELIDDVFYLRVFYAMDDTNILLNKVYKSSNFHNELYNGLELGTIETPLGRLYIFVNIDSDNTYAIVVANADGGYFNKEGIINDFIVEKIYVLDEAYIPDTIARKSDIPVPIIINYNTIKDAANSEVNTLSEQTWLKYIVNDTYKNYDWIIQRDGIKYNCTVIPDYDNEHIQILYFTRNEIEGTSGPLGNAIMKYSGLRIKLLPYTKNTYLIYKISNGGSLEMREFVFGETYNKNAYLIAAAQMSKIDTIDCKWVYTDTSGRITNVDAIFSVKDKSLTYVDGNGLINKVTFADNGSYDISKNNTKYILSVAPDNKFNIREFIDKFGFIPALNDDGHGNYEGYLAVTNKELFLDNVLCCGFNTSLAKCIYVNDNAEIVFFFEEGLAKGSVKVSFAENNIDSTPLYISWEPFQ